MSEIGLDEVVADGRWLAHRYVESDDAIQFRLVSRDDHRRVTFLIDAELGDPPLAVFSREQCVERARALRLRPATMIFHSAFCCSTLLARAFDQPGMSMGFKEPQILNDVIGLQLRGADPRRVAATMDTALLLLARPLASGEVNVIKPSNLINPLLPLINALRPGVSALMLHAPIDHFLVSIARKGIEGRAWVRELMWKLVRLGQVERFGFTSEELYRHTDLQVAALGWLIQQDIFRTSANSAPAKLLDSEQLLARPAASLSDIARHFAIGMDAQSVAAGPVFNTHSKDETHYSRDDRDAERAAAAALHGREIEMVMTWIGNVAAHASLGPDLLSDIARG